MGVQYGHYADLLRRVHRFLFASVRLRRVMVGKPGRARDTAVDDQAR